MPAAGAQALPCEFLMGEPRVLGLEGREIVATLVPWPERQPELEIRALEPLRFVLARHEALHQTVQVVVRRFETGDEELLDAVLDVAGEQRWEHSAAASYGGGSG